MLDHITSTDGKKLTKNSGHTNLSPHAIYFDQKCANRDQNKFSPDFSLSYFINRPKVQFNKTQYDWFPGKSQNSKKFHTKIRKIHSCV